MTSTNRVLLPAWNGRAGYAGPSLLRTMKRFVRNPLAARVTLATHAELSSAAGTWGAWVGLGILCVVASRQPLDGYGGLLVPQTGSRDCGERLSRKLR